MDSESPSLEEPEDDYEPSPHVFALLGRGAAGLFRRALDLIRGEATEKARWRKVWPTLIEGVSFAFLSTYAPLRFLPSRFRASGHGRLLTVFRLIDAAHRNAEEFWRLAAPYVAQGVLIAPIWEELKYRGLPILVARALENRLSPRSGQVAVLTIAAASSLYFAWRHNPVLGAMPLLQLAFGALAWSVAWRRGLRYSVLLHVLVNFFVIVPSVVRIYERAR